MSSVPLLAVGETCAYLLLLLTPLQLVLFPRALPPLPTKTDEYCDMVKAGIIDPLKVVRTALVDAASVSSLITTSECVIVEAPEDKKSAPAMPDMGMY
jgi:hypothetical protein